MSSFQSVGFSLMKRVIISMHSASWRSTTSMPQAFMKSGALAPLGVAAWEGNRFTHDDFGDAELHCGAGAEIARHQRAVEDCVLVGFLPLGLSETVDLRVGHGVAVLDAPIVTGGDDLPVPHEHRPDGQSALGQTLFRLVNRGSKKWIPWSVAPEKQCASLNGGSINAITERWNWSHRS